MEFLNFNEAFRDARRAGEKTFMYKGQRYSTDVAGESQKAPNKAYEDKSRVMEGVAAKSREMARPGRDAIEGVYPEAALIPGRGAAGLVAAALKAMRADKSGNWREKVPEGADPAKWREIVKQVDEAYPSGGARAAAKKETSGRLTAEQEAELAVSTARGAASRKQIAENRVGRAAAAEEAKRQRMMKEDKTSRSPRSRTREEDNIEYAKGGMAKKKPGYAKGGVIKAMCGASVPAAQKGKK
jgi:hypothetical protein